MEQLQKLIDEYVKWTQENRMAGKKIAVYLGLQVEQSPKHAAFYEAVGEWAKTFASSQPEHEQTVAAVRLLLFSAGEHLGSEAEWYLIAIQNYAKDFLGELSTEEKAQLGKNTGRNTPQAGGFPCRMRFTGSFPARRRNLSGNGISTKNDRQFMVNIRTCYLAGNLLRYRQRKRFRKRLRIG